MSHWASGVLVFLGAWVVLLAVSTGWAAWAGQGIRGIPGQDDNEAGD